MKPLRNLINFLLAGCWMQILLLFSASAAPESLDLAGRMNSMRSGMSSSTGMGGRNDMSDSGGISNIMPDIAFLTRKFMNDMNGRGNMDSDGGMGMMGGNKVGGYREVHIRRGVRKMGSVDGGGGMGGMNGAGGMGGMRGAGGIGGMNGAGGMGGMNGAGGMGSMGGTGRMNNFRGMRDMQETSGGGFVESGSRSGSRAGGQGYFRVLNQDSAFGGAGPKNGMGIANGNDMSGIGSGGFSTGGMAQAWNDRTSSRGMEGRDGLAMMNRPGMNGGGGMNGIGDMNSRFLIPGGNNDNAGSFNLQSIRRPESTGFSGGFVDFTKVKGNAVTGGSGGKDWTLQ